MAREEGDGLAARAASSRPSTARSAASDAAGGAGGPTRARRSSESAPTVRREAVQHCRRRCRSTRIPWGAETRSSRGGGDVVLVDEAAEQVAAVHLKILQRRPCSDG